MKCLQFPGRWWYGWRTWCDGHARSLQTGVAARWKSPAAPMTSTNLCRVATTTAAIHSKWKRRVRQEKGMPAGLDIATRWCVPPLSSILFLQIEPYNNSHRFFCSFFKSKFFPLPFAGPLLEVQAIRILSYPQYCRFRSLQKRIQDAATSPQMQNPHVMALGGVKAPPTTRLMYCRDTFSHPMLENNSNFSWQFSECL